MQIKELYQPNITYFATIITILFNPIHCLKHVSYDPSIGSGRTSSLFVLRIF